MMTSGAVSIALVIAAAASTRPVLHAFHNQTPFAVQRRLQFEGLQTVILPIQVKT